MYIKEMKSHHLLVALIFLFGCGGGGGGGSAEPAPTLSNITVTLSTSADSVDVNSAITLTWSSSLASSCSASGAWSGSKATSGTESVTIEVGGSNSFVLSCSATSANPGSASASVTGLRYFDGKVFDGYIRGAEVFVDTNNNLSLDSGETSVVTDNQGNFTKLLYADGTVISKGGVDLDTGADLSSLTLAHKMTGFEASKIISPITSLAAYMSQPADINAALGIDAAIDVMSVDPIPNLGQSSYDYIYEKGNQLTVIAYSLQNSVNAINQTTDTSQDYFLGIAEELEKIYAATPGLVDIESNTFIDAVVENITAKKVTAIDAINKANISSAISSVVPLIQVKSLASTTTAIQNFAFRTMQNDLQSLATGEASSETVTNYTSNLITYISTDQNISSTDLEIDISALSDSVSLDEDSSIEISPLTNDSYLRGQAVQLSIASSPLNGTTSLTDNVITYTPNADWNGSESFTYSIVQGSKSATGTIEVTVAPINDAPVINALSEFSVNEATQVVTTIAVTDVDKDDLTYALSGTDAGLFAISSSGALSFISSPDFENPADSDTNNVYDLTVSVSDGTLADEQVLSVTVLNITEVTNQAPAFTSSATFSAAENQADIGTVTATDADGDSLTFSISGSEINISSSGVLTFATAPDYETKTSYTATVTVSDGTASVTQDITVNVTDVADLTVSGTIFSSRYYVMDSDVPNVNNHDFSSNDTVAAAQELTNPSIVNGFVGTFTTTDSVTVEDTIDVYKISTSSNMYVNLDVSQYESGVKDLDINLYDTEGNPVEFSYVSGSTEDNETINLPNDGTYLIAVTPIAGASRYLLTLGQRFSSSSIAPKFNYVDGEVLSYIPFAKAGKASEFSDSKFIDPKLKERFNRLSGFHHLEPLMPGLRSLQPAELIAKFEDDISTSLTKAGFKLPSGKMLRYLAQNKVINRLRELNPDAVFDFNHKVKKMTAFSKDPLYYVQWNMERIGLETALNVVGQELKAVGVAVIDTGGPTVNSAAWNSTNFISGGYDFIDSDANPTDPDAEITSAIAVSHGTHVATTIGAKNDGNDFNGFPVSVLNVRVLGPDGGSNSDIANAILYSAGLSNSSGAVAPTSIPIKVINLSLGGSSPSSVLCSAVTDARAQGLVVVAASGNEQAEEPGLINYPAACPGVISVGATNSAGEITGYSNQNVYVDISAPGGDGTDRDGDGNDDLIWAWVTNTDIGGIDGTSMATPHVAGAIATLYAADTSMTPARVDSMLQSGKLTSDLGATGVDNVYGYGELNMPKMLENLYADNNANSVTFAYTNKYFLDFGNTTTQLNITLNKVGTGSLTVSSLGADSAAGLSYTDNSPNGFGSYTIFIDRDSMPNGEFSNTVYFNLSDNTEVAVPIYYSVGTPRGRADLGKLYVSIFNAADDSTVASGDLDMLSNGSLEFIASSLTNGNYFLLASTDPDNDGFVCSYGELCEYYPKLSSSDDYFTLNGSNISGYEISLGPMFKNGGVQSASLGGSDDKKKKGIKRESVANKILPIKFGNSKQTKVFGEKNFIPHSK